LHYINALNTFNELLRLKVVPIVNENDVIAPDKTNENDTLAALVASLVDADWLFLMTDVDALYTSNPKSNPNSKPLRVVDDIDALSVSFGDKLNEVPALEQKDVDVKPEDGSLNKSESSGSSGIACNTADNLSQSTMTNAAVTSTDNLDADASVAPSFSSTATTPTAVAAAAASNVGSPPFKRDKTSLKLLKKSPSGNKLVESDSKSADSSSAVQGSGQWGTGGMETKLRAASIATAAGVRTAICSTSNIHHITLMMNGSTDVGTQFTPKAAPIAGMKKWIAHGIKPKGVVIVDHGAERALLDKKSLFAAGVFKVQGTFHAFDCVAINSKEGKELGRGLCNFRSDELDLIKGLSSKLFAERLGYNPATDEVISRGNIGLTAVAVDKQCI
jgi:glutamate 5-kinase